LATTAPAVPTAALVDDFTGSTLNGSRWATYQATNDNGSAYTPAMDTVSGGDLEITGSGTNATGAGNQTGGVCMCPSGGSHQYGIWQVRARTDAGSGYGPVIGLLPDSGGFAPGYLNVMNITDPNRRTAYHEIQGPSGPLLNDYVSGDMTAWHTYTIEWRAGYVRMYLDNTVIAYVTAGGNVTIPTVPLHLYMQLVPGPTTVVPAPNASTPSKVVLYIDWVRYSP
jgi:beta-glucanase (GH16 family)